MTRDDEGKPRSASPPQGYDSDALAVARDRVMAQIAAFGHAADAAIADPSSDSLEGLREATDQLMRALAGILITIGQVAGHH